VPAALCVRVDPRDERRAVGAARAPDLGLGEGAPGHVRQGLATPQPGGRPQGLRGLLGITRLQFPDSAVHVTHEPRRVDLVGVKAQRVSRGPAHTVGHDDGIPVVPALPPSTKVFAVCAGLDKAWDVLVEEASKTQLLCKPCHVAKGAEDRPELRHGTYYVYWY
jgi:hypothetical protein